MKLNLKTLPLLMIFALALGGCNTEEYEVPYQYDSGGGNGGGHTIIINNNNNNNNGVPGNEVYNGPYRDCVVNLFGQAYNIMCSTDDLGDLSTCLTNNNCQPSHFEVRVMSTRAGGVTNLLANQNSMDDGSIIYQTQTRNIDNCVVLNYQLDGSSTYEMVTLSCQNID